MSCDCLVRLIDKGAGWMVDFVAMVMIKVMRKLYGGTVNECADKYVCLASDAVLFNWILVVIHNFCWPCGWRKCKVNFRMKVLTINNSLCINCGVVCFIAMLPAKLAT